MTRHTISKFKLSRIVITRRESRNDQSDLRETTLRDRYGCFVQSVTPKIKLKNITVHNTPLIAKRYKDINAKHTLKPTYIVYTRVYYYLLLPLLNTLIILIIIRHYIIYLIKVGIQRLTLSVISNFVGGDPRVARNRRRI